MDTPQASTSVQISPQPAVVSPAEPPNRRWVLWSAIGLTFLIFGIALGIFSAKFLNQSQTPSKFTSTPTPTLSLTPIPSVDPTADWKTYLNEKLGISFQYPNTLIIKEFHEYDDKGIFNISLGQKEVIETTLHPDSLFRIIVSVNNDKLSFLDVWSPDLINKNVQLFLVDNLPGQVVSGNIAEGAQKGIGYDYFTVSQANNTYIFLPPVELDKDRLQHRQILSTFKFLDQN